MNKIILPALLLVATVATAEEDATSHVATTPTAAAANATHGILLSSSTARNATGQIVWSCTYKVAATSKTLTLRKGCPNKLKFELKHR